MLIYLIKIFLKVNLILIIENLHQFLYRVNSSATITAYHPIIKLWSILSVLTNVLGSFKDKKILLLQGPVGPFFRRFATDLRNNGAIVYQVNFNGGDWLYNKKNSINFRKPAKEWRSYFEILLSKYDIDHIFLFGDCRPYHVVAHQIATRLGIKVGVFEEGYIRPNFITLEEGGVNNNSHTARDARFYFDQTNTEPLPEKQVGYSFAHMAFWTFFYYAFSSLLKPCFWHYQHHRPLNPFEGLAWIRSFWRKWIYRYKERKMQDYLTQTLSKQYFIFPLQVHNDSQIHTHSDFAAVKHTIRHVVQSFAQNAPLDTHLVIKHHPMDRGYNDYQSWIQQLEFLHNLSGRIHYIHDQHLPSLLNHSLGTIVVNSTVGLSALLHGSPLKVIGRAMYDFQQLTYQGTLDEFWLEAKDLSVDDELFTAFRNHLITTTQINGSFYKRIKNEASATGLSWPQKIMRNTNKLI